MISWVSDTCNLSCTTSNNEFITPRFNTITYGKHSIRYTGPKLWSLIPRNIKSSTTLSAFKKNTCKFDLDILKVVVHINNSRHLAWKYARIFVRGHYLFREANSFPRASLEENCELWGTDNVQGQISQHIFAPNGDYCLYYPTNLFCNARNFQNWGIFSDIPQF